VPTRLPSRTEPPLASRAGDAARHSSRPLGAAIRCILKQGETVPASSIPKHRLVSLILAGLQAGSRVAAHFHISTSSSIADRLMSFPKPTLIAFIRSLGPKAEQALDQLDSAFPLRRPPTLYLAFVESTFATQHIINTSRTLAKKGRHAALLLDSHAPIPAIFIDEPARILALKDKSVLQIPIRYERYIEYVAADPELDSYGIPSSITSLETALIWIPCTSRPKHAVIASCDYPAVRQIITLLSQALRLRLYLTYLDLETLRTLTGGATPRSATFTTTIDDPDEVRTLTVSDPVLSSKPIFASATQSSAREQTAGFYVNHPGLPSGGMGISRREGRVWLPSRLDYTQLAFLALSLIEQTEGQLKAQADTSTLITHYYASRARIGAIDVSGPPHSAWKELLRAVIQAEAHPDRQTQISKSLLERLVRFQNRLSLVPSAIAECPSCGYSSLATCPHCRATLSLRLTPSIEPVCQASGHDVTNLRCDCGTELALSMPADTYIVPEPPLLESICRGAAVITDRPFDVMFILVGTLLRVFPPAAPTLPAALTLPELTLWRTRAHIHTYRSQQPSKRQEFLRILNKTKEKCLRDGIKPSIERCSSCKEDSLNPKWLYKGDLCLPRILGLAIDDRFDGVHHAHELADVKYSDLIHATGAKLNIGLHLKSRIAKPPPLGVGRSTLAVKGLYAQVVYSAFKVHSGPKKLDAIGIAIPNILPPEVTESLQFAANKMGYSFLAITEEDWMKIVRVAEEKLALAD